MRIGCYLPSVSLHNYCLHIATCNLLVTCDWLFGYRYKRSHHERLLPIQACWITYIQPPCMPILIWCKQCPTIDSCAKQWSKCQTKVQNMCHHGAKKRASKDLETEKKRFRQGLNLQLSCLSTWFWQKCTTAAPCLLSTLVPSAY